MACAKTKNRIYKEAESKDKKNTPKLVYKPIRLGVFFVCFLNVRE